MKTDKFFTFSSKLSSSTVQVHAINLANGDNKNVLFNEHRLILSDYSDISFPIIFKQEHGNKWQDILDTGWTSLYLISDKIKTVLEENALTGWKTFSVKVLNKQGQQIQGYHGLSITGRCGKIDYSKSEIIEKQLVPTGPLVKYYKGLHIGLNKWDRTDFFLPEKYFGIMITQKTAEILKKNKLTNVKLENLAEIEMDYSAVQISLQDLR